MAWVRLVSLAIVALTLLPMVAMPVMADGISWRRETSNTLVWSHVQERSQYSIINFEDGTEKMIISIQVGVEELDSAIEMYWLFPVPCEPQNVTVDILSNVPRLEGEPFGTELAESLADSPLWGMSLMTQIWTIPLVGFYSMVLGIGTTGGIGTPNVIVHDSASEYGLTSAVVTADSAEDLGEYFQLIGLTIPEDDLALIDEYIMHDFSFVATRISDVDLFRNSAHSMNDGDGAYYMMGVETDFKTEQIFFPLKLTRGYGEAEIPILVQILGLANPLALPPTNQYLRVGVDYWQMDGDYLISGSSYYYGPTTVYMPDMLSFFEEQIGDSWEDYPSGTYRLIDQEFTTVTIEGRADALVEDLWLGDGAPLTVGATDFIIENGSLFVMISVILISALAGLITGMLIDRDRRHIRQYLLAGCCNVFTVGFATIAYRHYKKGWLEERDIPSEGIGAPRHIGMQFFSVYTIVFIGLTILTWLILTALAKPASMA